MRVLSKSRFKLGLECPNKLFYTGKKEYANSKKEDPFLLALAEGGFQVEELARMHYPNGTLIEGRDGEYEHLYKTTQELLKQENVIIYEAAFLFDGLFIRTDILVKKGNSVELIEVKSKSYDPADEFIFIGKQGNLVSSWKPYLFDIAFQKFVMQSCFPHWKIDSYIMMADKSKTTSIDGLNQMFRVTKKAGNRTGVDKIVKHLEETGASILGRKNVSNLIEKIITDHYPYSAALTFSSALNLLRSNYINNTFANWPTSFAACKGCEFKLTKENKFQGLKSGYEECFIKQHQWNTAHFSKPKTSEVWNFRKGDGLFNDGIHFMDQLTEDNIGLKTEADKLTSSERQWLQIEKQNNNDTTVYVNIDSLKHEMSTWVYPLHFIDFETSAVPLPFNRGRKPYEQVAFQFSHHIYHSNGSIDHATEYINNAAGTFPNFQFIRALKTGLSNDQGSIFKYSNHENTILNAIYEQLFNSTEPDKVELMHFIQSISHSKENSAFKWKGQRDMVDLLEIVKKYYYNPLTKGSNSIKAVLPAILNTSPFLQNKYIQPIFKLSLTSKNFSPQHIWLTQEAQTYTNPYKQLPRMFQDWTDEELDETFSAMEEVADGGAALTAYGKLQYTNMSKLETDELTNALLKYCELDTLAMVMIFEHFKELTS